MYSADLRHEHEIVTLNPDKSKVIVYQFTDWKSGKPLYDTCLVHDYWLLQKRTFIGLYDPRYVEKRELNEK